MAINGLTRKQVALTLVLATVAIDFLGMSIVIPVLPFYAIEFGASDTQLGLMYSVFAGAQLLSTLWMSQFSDRCGRRKAFLLSLFGSMVAFILQAAAWNVASLLAFRFVAGFFGGTMPVAMAYIGDATTPKERPRWMSSVGGMVGLVFMMGPALGAGLAEFNLNVPMIASACVSGVGLALAFKYIQEPGELVGKEEAAYIKAKEEQHEEAPIADDAESQAAANDETMDDFYTHTEEDDTPPPADTSAAAARAAVAAGAGAGAGGAGGAAGGDGGNGDDAATPNPHDEDTTTGAVTVSIGSDGDEAADGDNGDAGSATGGGSTTSGGNAEEAVQTFRRRTNSVSAVVDRGVKRTKATAAKMKINYRLVGTSAFVTFCNTMAFTALQVLTPLLLRDVLGWGSLQLGFLFVGISINLLMSQVVEFNWLQKHFGLLQAASVGAFMHGIGLYCVTLPGSVGNLSQIPRGILTIALMLFAANGMGMVDPAMSTFNSTLSDKTHRARVMAVGQFSSAAARMIAPIILTPVYEVSRPGAYSFAATWAILGFITLQVIIHCFAETRSKVTYEAAFQPHRSAEPTSVFFADLGPHMERICKERNWDLRWDEARQTLTELLEQSVPFIHKEGDLRREDINNIVTGLGHNAPFKVTKMVH